MPPCPPAALPSLPSHCPCRRRVPGATVPVRAGSARANSFCSRRSIRSWRRPVRPRAVPFAAGGGPTVPRRRAPQPQAKSAEASAGRDPRRLPPHRLREFRCRVKTHGSPSTEDPPFVLLFSLVARAQIKLRRVDGWWKIAAMLSRHARWRHDPSPLPRSANVRGPEEKEVLFART